MEQGYRIECSEHPEIAEVIDAPVGDVQGIAESHGLRFHGDAFAPCVTVTHTSEMSESRDFAAFADQRAHDVFWMTAQEREELECSETVLSSLVARASSVSK